MLYWAVISERERKRGANHCTQYPLFFHVEQAEGNNNTKENQERVWAVLIFIWPTLSVLFIALVEGGRPSAYTMSHLLPG